MILSTRYRQTRQKHHKKLWLTRKKTAARPHHRPGGFFTASRADTAPRDRGQDGARGGSRGPTLRHTASGAIAVRGSALARGVYKKSAPGNRDA